MKTAIILFAHGSRDPLWRAPIEAVAAQIVARDPNALVSCAYLELMEPDLPKAAIDLIAKGVTSIRVFPLFLGIGKHARADLPVLMAQLARQHPNVDMQLLPTAGEHERLVALLAELALLSAS